MKVSWFRHKIFYVEKIYIYLKTGYFVVHLQPKKFVKRIILRAFDSYEKSSNISFSYNLRSYYTRKRDGEEE